MKSRNGRSGVGRIGVGALFIVLGALGSCDNTDVLTGVGPQQSQAQKAKVSVGTDSTSRSPEDECHWLDGQWVCN